VSVAGQLFGQTSVIGTVRDGRSQAPVSGARLAIEQLDLTTTTDRDGRFRFSLPSGELRLAVRKLGYQIEERLLRVALGDTIRLEVDLFPIPNELPEIAAAALRETWQNGFARRQRIGAGQFITEELLRQYSDRTLSSLIRERIRGVQVVFQDGRAVLQTGSRCPMAIFQNGVAVYRPIAGASDDLPPDLDRWMVRDLRGVEVYRSASRAPFEYGQSANHCGMVLLWTRLA
jgi:hypothetical protein